MRCPYCLEELGGGKSCSSCGGVLPTESVAEPETSAPWRALKRLARLLAPLVPVLFVLYSTLDDQKLWKPISRWLSETFAGESTNDSEGE